jgi:hypothetical protein
MKPFFIRDFTDGLFPITCWRAHQSRVLNSVPWVICVSSFG